MYAPVSDPKSVKGHNGTHQHLYYGPRNTLKQEHPRGSIVDPQGLNQDGFNSLSCNMLKTRLFMYDIFQLNKLTSGIHV